MDLLISKRNSVKQLVFSILSNEYPLKIIELTNYIRKRYGKAVTFQAVKKAINELLDEQILLQQDKSYQINAEWVIAQKKGFDILFETLSREDIKPTSIDSIKEEISVFSFTSLNKMTKFWQDILLNWFKHFKKGDYNINCYQGAHSWEGLLHTDTEGTLMGDLKKKGIISYALSLGVTPLDKYNWKIYRDVGVNVSFTKSQSAFDNSHYIATYGDIIIQVKYPDLMVKLLDNFYKKYSSIDQVNFKELSDIANKEIEVKMTVIKNLEMAKQINQSIISQIE